MYSLARAMIDRLELKVLHSSTKSDAVTPRHFVDSFMVSSRHPFQHFEACRGKRDRSDHQGSTDVYQTAGVNILLETDVVCALTDYLELQV